MRVKGDCYPLQVEILQIVHKLFKVYDCTTCGKPYKHYPSLWRHKKYECQKEPAFRCFFCNYKAKQKVNLNLHILNRHKDKFINSTETVAANYCLKFETSKHTP
ncbi:unnamed protein product [Acanthoscelides obtectus]|uniref:C2H2-type domain-containing protein n=1 Tax=Acanthoscelides obtectus TaxID=200917 RepID=A0A9P0NYM0_ACAOB|nr:unnamed protein product [Acanthoscelides obtectus]CAK1669724.1 Longitudinals lacking protein, isoforms A/B/D/L [Acanthoscelides obtectus]